MHSLTRINEPGYEANRLKTLRDYNILDTLTEEDYENITYLASTICQVPIAVISFVDDNRQWFKSHRGLKDFEHPREYSFCAHAINKPQEFLIVTDAREDTRFESNPLVTGDPNIVFYAGVPLVSESGYGIGAVCVIDNQPRELTEQQLKSLKILSSHVMALLEMRRSNEDLDLTRRQLEHKNRELIESATALEKSQERLRKVCEGSDVMVATRDADNELSFITKGWTDFTGRSLEELLLFGWKDLIHPDDQENFVNNFYEAFENRQPYSLEFRMKNAQGNYVWLLTNGSPDVAEDGSFSGYVSTTIDISGQKQTENDLDKKGKTLALALAAGKLGTFELDIRSGTMVTSKQYNVLFGLQEDEKFTLSRLLSIIHPEDRSAMQEAFAKSIRQNLVYETEYRITTPNGETHWIRESGIPIYNDAGNALQLSGISMNITEQKKSIASLEKKAQERPHELITKFTNLENMVR